MNKLGITNSEKLWEIEYYLFNMKYHLIDEYFTFNMNSIFNVEYLEKIHSFLFNDIYCDNKTKIREEISKEKIDEINKKLDQIRSSICDSNIEELKDLIYSIWEEQLFYDGNTRTLLCFLKVISKGFDIDLNYDFTKDINKDCFILDVLDTIKIKQKVK